MMDKNEIELIIEQIKKEVVPIGSILIYSSEKVPDNYLPCDGRELPKQLFPELYALIGSTWGETTTTFFLPDLQGQFVRGWDKEGNVDSERRFGSEQEDTIQGHGHKIKINDSIYTESSGYHRHKVYYHSHSVRASGAFGSDYCVYEVSYGSDGDSYSSNGNGTTSEGSHSHTLKINIDKSTGGPIDSTYGRVRLATETRPKNIAMIFCIKVK